MDGELRRKLLQKAVEVAPFCNSKAAVGRAVNAALGEDRSNGSWRGLWVRYPEEAAQVERKLTKRVATVTPPLCEDFDIERFFELSVQAAEEWQKREQRQRILKTHIGTETPIGLVHMSDFHIGAPGVAHRQLYADIQAISDHPQMYAGVGGDGVNNHITGYLMWVGLNDVFAAGDQQVDVFVWLLSLLADSGSLIYVGSGNHDAWTTQLANLDARWTMFKDVPHLYQGQGGLIELTVGDAVYKIYRRHRQRWSSVFNPAHAVVAEYQRSPYDFDIGVIEHQHMSHGAEFDGKMRADGSTVRIAIRPGTYMLHDPYADDRGYHYASNELQCVILWPDRFRMHRIRGLYETIEFLDAING